MNKITIKDIARELNIHHATVSRALRNDPRISKSTREKIIHYANEKGYEINQNALNLRNNNSNEIALIVPNISHYTFSNFISRFSDMAFNEGYMVSVFQSKERVEIERDIVNTVIRNRVAGVVASISNKTVHTEHFRKIITFGIPLVFFDRVGQDIETSKVMTANYDAAFDAVNYLISKGYRRIAHLTGPKHINVYSDRNKGYLEALSAANLPYFNSMEISKEFEIEDGFLLLESVWSQTMKPDAILCDSFTLSAGANEFCRQNHIRIPKDLAIIAIANDPFSALIQPSQTVMEQSIEEIANSAYELLLNLIQKRGDCKTEVRYHKASLVIRESV